MIRIAGVDLQEDWKLDYALTHIKGIGWSHSGEIIKDLKLKGASKMSDLSSEDVAKIGAKLEDYLIEGDLARKTREDIQRLKVIGSYRGIRHTRGLPVRGQRTRSNARTKRGKRRTVGAFRKEALARLTTAKKEKEE
jgi:small subunit ribosomal protein S13